MILSVYLIKMYLSLILLELTLFCATKSPFRPTCTSDKEQKHLILHFQAGKLCLVKPHRPGMFHVSPGHAELTGVTVSKPTFHQYVFAAGLLCVTSARQGHRFL